MEYIVGLILTVVIMGTAVAVGPGRERSFYAAMMMVVASYYILFAVMGASRHAVAVESLVAGVFMAAALVGFRTSLWVVVAALIGHGLFDSVHHLVIANPGVPHWWPGFCLSFDVAAGGLLALLLRTKHRLAVQARWSP